MLEPNCWKQLQMVSHAQLQYLFVMEPLKLKCPKESYLSGKEQKCETENYCFPSITEPKYQCGKYHKICQLFLIEYLYKPTALMVNAAVIKKDQSEGRATLR